MQGYCAKITASVAAAMGGNGEADRIHCSNRAVLCAGWVHGAFIFGQAPWAVNSIANLPAMRGKKAAAFCTFALDPGSSLDKLTMALGDTGAYVIGGLAMNRSKLDQHSEEFAARLLEATVDA